MSSYLIKHCIPIGKRFIDLKSLNVMYYWPFDRSMRLWIVNEFFNTSNLSACGLPCCAGADPGSFFGGDAPLRNGFNLVSCFVLSFFVFCRTLLVLGSYISSRRGGEEVAPPAPLPLIRPCCGLIRRRICIENEDNIINWRVKKERSILLRYELQNMLNELVHSCTSVVVVQLWWYKHQKIKN